MTFKLVVYHTGFNFKCSFLILKLKLKYQELTHL